MLKKVVTYSYVSKEPNEYTKKETVEYTNFKKEEIRKKVKKFVSRK